MTNIPWASGDAPRIQPEDWLEVMQREYLRSYIGEGGASVKVVVADSAQLRASVWARIRGTADDAGYLVAEVRSEVTKVHLAQEVFFAVARQVPWPALAMSVTENVARANTGFEPGPGAGSVYARLRQQFGLEQQMVAQAVFKGLQEAVFADPEMSRDFRLAMLPLCRDASGAFGDAKADSQAILAWLTGAPFRVTTVKPYQIFSKITRANATLMFESLLHWIRKAGRTGLILLIDLCRLVESPPRPRSDGIYYTRSTLLDAYEVLRQFIDSTDRMEGCMVVGFVTERFLDADPFGRGMASYQALQYRLLDEVRDKRLANPLASLVRLKL